MSGKMDALKRMDNITWELKDIDQHTTKNRLIGGGDSAINQLVK